jgi:hypothetical protein
LCPKGATFLFEETELSEVKPESDNLTLQNTSYQGINNCFWQKRVKKVPKM